MPLSWGGVFCVFSSCLQSLECLSLLFDHTPTVHEQKKMADIKTPPDSQPGFRRNRYISTGLAKTRLQSFERPTLFTHPLLLLLWKDAVVEG
jgi:hypothetical protein